MALLKLLTTLVHASQSYSFPVSGRVTVRQIAAFLTHTNPAININTLEMAYPLAAARRLQDAGLQTGDRLALFLQPARAAAPPHRTQPGDKILRFRRGAAEMVVRGKKGVLVGKPEDTRELLPDVDIRHFISPAMLPYISRGCLWLNFEEATRTWYATRPGDTRVMIDEFELGAERLPLEGTRRIRFFPPPGNYDYPPQDRPIGELTLQIEEVQTADEGFPFEVGSQRLRLQTGIEGASYTLRASGNVQLSQLVNGLAHHGQLPLSAATRLYLLRLVAPDTTLEMLNPSADMFLYASAGTGFAQQVLLLRPVHQPDHVFTLPAGTEDEEKIIGCRRQPAPRDALLDVDLYDVVAKQLPPMQLNALPYHQARLIYRAADNSWWIRAEESSDVPLFLNHTRVTGGVLRLTSGDVLSVGSQEAYTRLEVEITFHED